MDNITHSLVGVMVAQNLWKSYSNQSLQTKKVLHVSALLASSFPDLDMLYASITPHLGYLLHHRGHTHTLLGLLPQIAFVFFSIQLFFRFVLNKSLEHQKLIFTNIAICFLLHIVLDYFNSYGVHPFWPIRNHWHYGDSVFIVEPLYYAALLPLLYHSTHSLTIRMLTCAILPFICMLAFKMQMMSIGHGIFLLALFGFLTIKPLPNVEKSSLILFFFITLLFFINSSMARQKIDPKQNAFDVSIVPMPANPFCLQYIKGELSSDKQKILYSQGLVDLLSFFSTCKQDQMAHFNEGVWTKETHAIDLLDLTQGHEKDCWMKAWLKFARFPYKQESTWFDLRFNRKSRRNFTSFDMEALNKEPCPGFLPPWVMPRSDLLQ